MLGDMRIVHFVNFLAKLRITWKYLIDLRVDQQYMQKVCVLPIGNLNTNNLKSMSEYI